MKQVFKDLRTKYKNAVYILTGWKIDMDMRSSSKPVVLRSIFAENESDRLEFQMSSSGGIQLMDTAFAKQIDEKVLFYLTTYKSFPAFLIFWIITICDSVNFLQNSNLVKFEHKSTRESQQLTIFLEIL